MKEQIANQWFWVLLTEYKNKFKILHNILVYYIIWINSIKKFYKSNKPEDLFVCI